LKNALHVLLDCWSWEFSWFYCGTTTWPVKVASWPSYYISSKTYKRPSVDKIT